jgi:hypothetical protein
MLEVSVCGTCRFPLYRGIPVQEQGNEVEELVLFALLLKRQITVSILTDIT